MSGDIKQWLDELGLSQYAKTFSDNAVSFEALPYLTEEDLKELGLALGHRRILQAAIKGLKEETGTAKEVPRQQITELANHAEAERRQLTVLFCDLVGSTELSAKLDPEDMRELLRMYQEACSNVIERYEGYVAKFMGDGVYAYFGYPTAHEDDAERAVSAGLEIIEIVANLERDLAVRIGVATGNVAVGDLIGEGSAEEANVVGEAPNLAARLQSLAKPNTIVVGETTRALAGSLFEFADLGQQTLKGFSEPIRAWSVLGHGHAESRFEAVRGERLTELVGREEELEILLRRWERARAGTGQVVFVSGEPGIGKSRLVHALRERIEDDAYYVRIQQSSPLHTNSAFFPFAEQTAHSIGITPEDSNTVKIEKLEDWIRIADQPIEEHAPLFGSLLGIDTTERYAPLEVSPQRQRTLLFKAFEDRIKGITAKGPFLYVVEDCHWLDPTSLEQLSEYIDIVPGRLAALIIVTYRPEFDAPWIGQANTTLITLNRLEHAQSTSMVSNIRGGNVLSEDLIESIADRTDGVPLFVEELTKAVLEASEDGQMAAGLNVPASLQDSLEARLDRLGPAKEVAQIGAVIGRSFDYGLLSRVSAFEEAKLQESLANLVQSGLASRLGAAPTATFTFKHALVQDTAYASLLRDRRAEIHNRVATALEAINRDGDQIQPEIIAHHFTEAGQTEIAIEYWKRAGENSWKRPATAEAIEHFRRGIELTQSLPESAGRSRLELDLQFRLAPILQVFYGAGASEPVACYERAQELARQLDDKEKLFPIMFGHWMICRGQKKSAEADAIVEELLELAGESGDSLMQLQAHHAAWGQPFNGRVTHQSKHIEKALQIYDPAVHAASATAYGNHDAGMCALYHKSVICWSTGYPLQSRQHLDEAAKLSEEIAHPPSRVYMAHLPGWIYYFARDARALQERTSYALQLSNELGLLNQVPMSTCLRGWAVSMTGDAEDGVRQIREGIDAILFRHSSGALASSTLVLAEGIAKTKRWDEAIDVVRTAFERMNNDNEHLLHANALSLMGDLLLEQSPNDLEPPEIWYQQAINYAREQKTKMWELRATNRLARMWQTHGRPAEAQDLLVPLYSGFTEGFDTVDLKEAKSLLDEMS